MVGGSDSEGEEELDAGAFLKVAKDAMKRLGKALEPQKDDL